MKLHYCQRLLAGLFVLSLFSCGASSDSSPAASVAVTGVAVNKQATTVLVSKTESLVATVSPSNATNQNVSWSTSDSKIASVGTDGLVTGIADGSATIIATTDDGGKTASCAVTVSSTAVAVTGISLDAAALTVSAGKTKQLTAAITPSNATDQNVTWSTSDSTIAMVGSGGLVSGVSAGSATITVKTSDGGKTASCVVTVATLSGTISNWTNFLSNNSFTASSGVYAQAVIVKDDGSGGAAFQAGCSNTCVVSSDGSFALSLTGIASTYLLEVTNASVPSGVTLDPSSGIYSTVPTDYGMSVWLYNSSGTKVGEMEYRSYADGSTAGYPRAEADIVYSSGSIAITGSITDNDDGVSVANTINMNLVEGWNWQIKTKTSSTVKNETASDISTLPSGLTWYVN